MSRTPDDVASAILETVPATMRVIRTQMRSGRPDGLSVPQFRLLRFVAANAWTSLSAVAEHLGASVPATSEQVDRLVRSGFVTRTQCATERRRVELRLTGVGRTSMAECERRTRDWLCERLGTKSEADLDRLIDALIDLRSLIAEPGTEH